MLTFLTVLHVFVGLVLILVVLLQTGKGNAMGSAFGGSSQTVFGASGAGNFLTKFTTASAVIFMLTSLSLSSMSSHKEQESLLSTGESSAPAQSPATSLPSLPDNVTGERESTGAVPLGAVESKPTGSTSLPDTTEGGGKVAAPEASYPEKKTD